MVAVALALSSVEAASGQSPSMPEGQGLDGRGPCVEEARRAAPRQDLAVEVVRLVNAHRASIGLAPVALSPALMRSALWKSNHMATLDYLEHDDPAPPVTRSFGQRVTACGYRGVSIDGETFVGGVGENIAYGSTTAEGVMRQWLDSPGHRRNIEDPDWDDIGVGAAGPRRHWTQNFGRGDALESPNLTPFAAADSLTFQEDRAAAVNVTANDVDSTDDWLHVTLVDSVNGLTAGITSDGRGVLIRPRRNLHGTFTVGVDIADLMGQPSSAPLTISVTPVNDRPDPRSDVARLRRGVDSVKVPVGRNDRDVDGDRLKVGIARRPRFGRARVVGRRVIYRPNRLWPGRDVLTYRVHDPSGASATAAIRIRGARRR